MERGREGYRERERGGEGEGEGERERERGSNHSQNLEAEQACFVCVDCRAGGRDPPEGRAVAEEVAEGEEAMK